MFEISVENTFDFGSDEYAELFDNSAATAFQHPKWLAALYNRLLAHNGAEPLIVVARRTSDRRLAMVLPLVRRRYAFLRTIEFADLRVSDYSSPVATAETFALLQADKAAIAAVRLALKPYDLLRIGKLTDGGLPIEALLAIDHREDMGTNAYATRLDGTLEDWRENRLGKSYRKELDKKRRQLNRRGDVRFALAEEPASIQAAFEAMKVFRGIRFEDRGGGELLQIAPYFEFYRGVASETPARLTRTYTLTVDGRIVAVVLGLAHGGSFLVIMTGFDHAEFKNQSIGSLMFEDVASDCIARGEKLLDFTIGDEPYKLIFGSERRPMWRVSRAGSAAGLAAGLLIEKLPAAKALARNIFHPARDLGAKQKPEPSRP